MKQNSKAIMSKECRECVRNAVSVAKRDGYDQCVYEDVDGGYAFGRMGGGAPVDAGFDVKRVVGIVKATYKDAILMPEFIPNGN